MTRVYQSFDGGADTNSVQASDPQATGDTAFASMATGGSSSFKYSTTHQVAGVRGFLGAKITPANNQNTYGQWDTAFGSRTDFYVRFYIYPTANPTVATQIWRCFTGATRCCSLTWGTGGHLTFADANNAQPSGGDSGLALPLNAWSRVELHVVINATTGSMQVRQYSTAESTTPDADVLVSNFNTGAAAADTYRLGVANAPTTAPAVFWVDEYALDTAGWIGNWQAAPDKAVISQTGVEILFKDQSPLAYISQTGVEILFNMTQPTGVLVTQTGVEILFKEAVVPPTTVEDTFQGFGAFIDGVPGSLSPLVSLETAIGQPVSPLHWYVQWKDPAPVDQLLLVTSGGTRVPMITWQPFNTTLASILAGSANAYIDAFATALASVGSTVYLRFANQMQSGWMPWSADPDLYVQVWHYIWNRFASIGATNVKWVWAPNELDDAGGQPLESYWPGESFVDIIGFDGYNWGTTPSTQQVGGGGSGGGGAFVPLAGSGTPNVLIGMHPRTTANRNDVASALTEIEGWMGRQVDIAHHYSSHFADPIISSIEQTWANAGRTIFKNWKPNNPNGSPMLWLDIAKGFHDADIDAQIANVKAFGKEVFICFHHEPVGEPGGAADPGYGNAADYVAAWQHIVTRFRLFNVTNVKWVWCLVGFRTTAPSLWSQWYPGDAFIDWLSFDPYNNFGTTNPDANWLTFSQIVQPFYTWATQTKAGDHSKPIMLAEFGAVEGRTNSKGAWFDDILAKIKANAFPNLKALVYYNLSPDVAPPYSDAGVSSSPYFNWPFTQHWWSIDSSVSSRQRFAALVNDPAVVGSQPPPQPGTAQLRLVPNGGIAPLTVTLDASASVPSAGATITSYTFHPGDGSPAIGPQSQPTAIYTYTLPGVFTASVDVLDSVPSTATATATETISDLPAPRVHTGPVAWREFIEILNGVYARLTALSAKHPIWATEVGSAPEVPTDPTNVSKGKWLKSLLSVYFNRQFSRLNTVVYFDADLERQWALEHLSDLPQIFGTFIEPPPPVLTNAGYYVSSVLLMEDGYDPLYLYPRALNGGQLAVQGIDLGFPEIRENLDPRTQQSGVDDYTKYVGARPVSIDLVLLPGAEPLPLVLDRLLAWLAPHRRPVLVYTPTGAEPRRVMVRGVNLPRPWGLPNRGGVMPVQASWKGRDGVVEDLVAQEGSLAPGTPFTDPTLGFTFPLTFPFDFATGGSVGTSGSITIRVDGNMPASPILAFPGPVTNPRFEVTYADGTVRAMEFASAGKLILVAGQTAVVDVRARSIQLNGQPGVNNSLRKFMSRKEWPMFFPGIIKLRYYPEIGTIPCLYSYRNAYL